MNWFEEQLTKRKSRDDQMLETAFAQAAGIVCGQKTADAMLDANILTERAIDGILLYFHLKPVEIPDPITDPAAQLDYCLRHYGIMKRNVLLHGDWFRDAYGVMLTHRRDSGEPVVLLPDRFGRSYRFRDRDGIMKRVTPGTAALFTEDAWCFYKPLPHGRLTARDLLAYMRSCISGRDWLALGGCTLLMTLVGMLIPQIVRLLLSDTLASRSIPLLTAVGASLLCTVISMHLLGMVAGAVVRKLQGTASLTMQSALMMRILSLPTALFEEISTGELAGIAPTVDVLCEQLVSIAAGICTALTAVVLFLVQIFHISPALGVPALAVVLVTLLFGCISAHMQGRLTAQQTEQTGKESQMRYNMITGIQKIRLSGAEKRFFAKWLTAFTKSRKLTCSPGFPVYAGGILTLCINLFSTIVLYTRAARSGVSGADFIAFMTAFSMLLGAVRIMTDVIQSAGRVRPALRMLGQFLQAEPETAGNRQLVTDLTGSIELNNVYFRYHTEAPYILQNLSLKIRPKEYVAVVGRTGCGKSTLIRILLGLRIPERGAVYYGGQDLNNLDLSSLRRRIGTVMQNGELFPGDIFSNITISSPDATLEDAWAAAETAGIADDIRAMPMGMQTLISAGQGGISGGQKQRILIARAIVSRPKILILDEATSALDNITQRQISDALDRMGCTRIVIAHRLSTIRHCDRILVLDHGSIAEDGTYEELLSRGGIFTGLVERQML